MIDLPEEAPLDFEAEDGRRRAFMRTDGTVPPEWIALQFERHGWRVTVRGLDGDVLYQTPSH